MHKRLFPLPSLYCSLDIFDDNNIRPFEAISNRKICIFNSTLWQNSFCLWDDVFSCFLRLHRIHKIDVFSYLLVYSRHPNIPAELVILFFYFSSFIFSSVLRSKSKHKGFYKVRKFCFWLKTTRNKRNFLDEAILYFGYDHLPPFINWFGRNVYVKNLKRKNSIIW